GCPDAEHPVASGVVVDIAADGSTYTVSQESKTNTNFIIERVGANYVRTCTVPDSGGCRAGGTW
ncbi:MAG: hypothetical protein M3401_13860, partial [Actinomycetota bacterium]|nr:hypothetical protein [Actinomycetota bacterium]